MLYNIVLFVYLLCLILEIAIAVWLYTTDKAVRRAVRWMIFRHTRHLVTVYKDQDWVEWLESNLGPEGKNWNVKRTYSEYNSQTETVELIVKRKYDLSMMQFKLIYSQQQN